MKPDFAARYSDMQVDWNAEWAGGADEYYWRTVWHHAVVERYMHGTVLDVGCGCGFLCARHFPNIAHYTGVDISDTAIEKARFLFPGATFLVHDAEFQPLPFGNDTFDTVICSETLEHLVEHDLILRELQRVCLGYMVITVPTSMGGCGHVWPKWDYDDLIAKFSPLGTIVEVVVQLERSFNLVHIRKDR